MNARKVRIAPIAVLLLLLSLPMSAGVASQRDVSVYIGKTSRRVNVFGWVVPTTERKVTIKLFKDGRDGNVRLIDETRVSGERNEEPPYGSRNGTFYSAWLQRPTSGDCIAKVRVRGETKGSMHFPCTTPDFGTGTALLVGDETRTIDSLIADDLTERAYGLMYRKRLAPEKGMAFLFPDEQQGGFWMKNTLIPLSIAFIDSNDVVIDILDMTPCWQDPCPSYTPGGAYTTALEVNRGAFDRWGIEPGDRIEVTPDP